MLDKVAKIATRLRGFLHHTYTERQIYLRSHGQVQFVSLSPLAQVGMTVIAFVFLGWVAFTSVNVVFKEQIIAAKERRFVKMQSAYEERIARMQGSYDDLNGQLVIAQERFLATTRTLEAKHQQISDILAQREAANRQLDDMRTRVTKTSVAGRSQRKNQVLMAATDMNGAARVSRIDKPAETAPSGILIASAAADEVMDGHTPPAFGSFIVTGDPETDQLQARLASLDMKQQVLINAMEETSDRQIREMEQVIAMTGVTTAEKFKDRVGTAQIPQGGPYVDMVGNDVLAGGEEEVEFSRQVYRISQNLGQLAELNYSIAKLPLAEPLADFRLTSDFGPRVDPFNKRMAFHAGLDMAAAYNSLVYATSPGVVSYAARKGPYGRLVEIDHGNGIKTRFGHLNSINVKVGQKIEFRDVIGKVGSSGRSSGPHLHYEVWFDGKARDPAKFIEAGRYVFTQQG